MSSNTSDLKGRVALVAGFQGMSADKNVTTIALELPIACVKAASSNIVGAWTTASQRQARLLNGAPTSGHVTPPKNGGAWTQVSRLGMPLVNEVVIGLKDKDKFNAAKPKDDGQFADYVTNPTLPALINILFKDAVGLPNLAPTNFPRTDLVAAFLTGVEGVNKPTGVAASEMLRLNLGLAPTPKATQSNLGVLGGDLAGFPNGRRPGDDVVLLVDFLNEAADTRHGALDPRDRGLGLAAGLGACTTATTYQPLLESAPGLGG